VGGEHNDDEVKRLQTDEARKAGAGLPNPQSRITSRQNLSPLPLIAPSDFDFMCTFDHL
jgi:hypothetical protein